MYSKNKGRALECHQYPNPSTKVPATPGRRRLESVAIAYYNTYTKSTCQKISSNRKVGGAFKNLRIVIISIIIIITDGVLVS